MQPRHLCQTQKRHKTSGYLNYTENSPVCPGLPWLWRQDLPQVWGSPIMEAAGLEVIPKMGRVPGGLWEKSETSRGEGERQLCTGGQGSRMAS